MSDASELGELNEISDETARQVLGDCCSSAHWVAAVARARPWASIADLMAASDAAVATLSDAELRAALDGHPRIGDRRPAGWSVREQAGVSDAGPGVLAALAEGNAVYEQRFGHIYLACATGRSAAELLGFLHERLGNDRETEWAVVASELAKINRIRLRALIGAGG